MRLTSTQFVTLDGVYQGPGSPDEDRSDGFVRGGWMVPYMDQTFVGIAAEWLGRADALLLGRRTYEAFAEAWPRITDPDDPFSERMNGLPKYVATHTLTEATWEPTTILDGSIVEQVTELRQRPGRELQLHGSARLTQTLLANGLIDEIRLVISPVILGQGRRYFPTASPPIAMTVAEHTATPGGLTILVLHAEGDPRFETYEGVAAIRE
ncbi:MAG: dihydrofolate reductase family protein [Ilumatobacteraceae bacterium]